MPWLGKSIVILREKLSNGIQSLHSWKAEIIA